LGQVAHRADEKKHSKLQLDYTRGADKSLALPGKKQATATADFDFYISYL
jgi:hypothetical protein